MNKKNLKLFIESYMNRMDITGKLASDLTCDALLVVGSKSSQSSAAEYMHSHMDKVNFSHIFFSKKKDLSFICMRWKYFEICSAFGTHSPL